MLFSKILVFVFKRYGRHFIPLLLYFSIFNCQVHKEWPTAFPKQMVKVVFNTVVRLVFQNVCTTLWSLISAQHTHKRSAHEHLGTWGPNMQNAVNSAQISKLGQTVVPKTQYMFQCLWNWDYRFSSWETWGTSEQWCPFWTILFTISINVSFVISFKRK